MELEGSVILVLACRAALRPCGNCALGFLEGELLGICRDVVMRERSGC